MRWPAGLADQLGELVVLLVCYLVLSLCGWSIDHVLVDAEAEPAP